MLRLNAEKLLEEQGKSIAWLWKKTSDLSYSSFYKLIKHQTQSIHLDTLEKMCYYLKCGPSELFYDDGIDDENIKKVTKVKKSKKKSN